MKRFAHALIAAAALAATSIASAQTLRWASQGDAQTMDPVSQNEGLTNSVQPDGLRTPDHAGQDVAAGAVLGHRVATGLGRAMALQAAPWGEVP